MPNEDGNSSGNGSGAATALLNQTANAAGRVLGHLRAIEWSGPDLDGAATVRTRSMVVRRIDPRSVAGVTAFLAGIVALTLWTATLLVWVIGSVTGVVGGTERFLHDIGFTGFHFMSTPVVGGMLVLTVAAVFGVTVFTTLIAVAYNCYAATLGQLTIEVDDGDVPVAAPAP
jgi:Transmembrane domain of unknown function (DUF3566)